MYFLMLCPQVGKVTLHAKCASAKGGLHRYHPLVFPQPYLCLLDVTFHMVSFGGAIDLKAGLGCQAFAKSGCFEDLEIWKVPGVLLVFFDPSLLSFPYCVIRWR